MSELKLKTCRRGHEYVPRTKDCPQCQSIRAKKWAEENAELIKLRDKARYEERKSEGYYEGKEHRSTPERKLYLQEYNKKNKDILNPKIAKRRREARAECPIFKLAGNLRSLVRMAFKTKGLKKTKRTLEILGCSIEEFHEHLKKTAIDNYGFWSEEKVYHIDHRIPLITARTEEALIKLNHYTNLQLLYPEDNLKKGAKI